MARKRITSRSRNFIAVYAVVALVCIYLIVIGFRAFQSSAFLDRRDRINIVFYGEEAVLLSLGLVDDVHYIVSFSHADKVSVPGGYGRYLVGSLGKLASLEKDPKLISRTFSSMASAYVDYFVVPNDADVFEKPDTDTPAFASREFIGRLFSGKYSTNASFLDKVYIGFLLSQRREQDFVVLRSTARENEDGELEFSEKHFLKKYKGFFYHQSLREEAQEVNIVYESYPGALTITNIIEGQGIRVVDLAREEKGLKERCTVIVDGKGQSKTAFYLGHRFGCKIRKGTVEGADITFTMGSTLTEEWK